MKRLFFMLLLVLSWTYGYSEVAVNILDIRSMGVGGTYLYPTDDEMVILNNPSGLALIEGNRFYFPSFVLSSTKAVYDLSYGDKKEVVEDIQNLEFSEDVLKTLYGLRGTFAWTGPIYLGYTGNGIGLLIYNTSDMLLRIKQSAGIPYASLDFDSEIGITAGVGFEIPVVLLLESRRLYGGVNFKYIIRKRYYNDRMSILQVVDLVDDPSKFFSEVDYHLGGIGIGSDISLYWRGENIDYVFVFQDWFSTRFSWKKYVVQDGKDVELEEPISDTVVNPSLDFGVVWRMKRFLFIPSFFLSNFRFIGEIHGVDRLRDNFFLKLHFGAEVKIFQFLWIRAGLNQGYPTVGVGIDLDYLRIDAAIFTEELGARPGQIPHTDISLGVRMRF